MEMNGTKINVQRPTMKRLAHILMATTVLTGMAAGASAQDATSSQSDTTELAPIVLEGATYETEGTNSYTTKQISVGDKDTRTLREVPQSTTVLTRERLDDGNFSILSCARRPASSF